MIVTIVHISVKPNHLEEFIEVIADNHRNSILEPGNLRFDVLQSSDNPNHFVLYEAYESEEAAAAHKNTPHYLKWRDTVESWMEKPRQGFRHKVILPTDLSQW